MKTIIDKVKELEIKKLINYLDDNPSKEKVLEAKTKEEVDALFGHGSNDEVVMRIDNLTLNNYEKMQTQWKYLQTRFPGLFDKDALWESYTSVRYQTAINENGIADEGSLHNLRVVDVDVDANLKFIGSIWRLL